MTKLIISATFTNFISTVSAATPVAAVAVLASVIFVLQVYDL